MTKMRPAPADLALIASTETIQQMMRRYRASKSTIYHWMKCNGIQRQPLRGGFEPKAMPADFPQHYRESLKLLTARYGVGDGVLTRWRRELGGIEKASVPTDFADRFAASTIDELRAHYRRGWVTISRWIKEAGLSRPAPIKKPAPAKAMKPDKAMPVAFLRAAPEVTRVRHARPNAYQTAALNVVVRDMSEAGRAADYLRRFGPVVRCDERGRYNENGTHWRRGSTILTAADVIERAEYNGWRSDAWAKVA
jgi:hypothetical protein